MWLWEFPSSQLAQCRTTGSSEPTEGRKCGAVRLRNKRWRSNTKQPLPFDVRLKRPYREWSETSCRQKVTMCVCVCVCVWNDQSWAGWLTLSRMFPFHNATHTCCVSTLQLHNTLILGCVSVWGTHTHTHTHSITITGLKVVSSVWWGQIYISVFQLFYQITKMKSYQMKINKCMKKRKNTSHWCKDIKPAEVKTWNRISDDWTI